MTGQKEPRHCVSSKSRLAFGSWEGKPPRLHGGLGTKKGSQGPGPQPPAQAWPTSSVASYLQQTRAMVCTAHRQARNHSNDSSGPARQRLHPPAVAPALGALGGGSLASLYSGRTTTNELGVQSSLKGKLKREKKRILYLRTLWLTFPESSVPTGDLN